MAEENDADLGQRYDLDESQPMTNARWNSIYGVTDVAFENVLF